MTLFNLQNQAVVKVLALLTMIMMVASLVPVSVFAQAEGETPAEPEAEPQAVDPAPTSDVIEPPVEEGETILDTAKSFVSELTALVLAPCEPQTSVAGPTSIQNINSGDFFNSVNDALADCDTNDGDTIELSASIIITQQITIDRPITLDGNGYTISPTFARTDNDNNSSIGILDTEDVVVKDVVIDSTGGTNLHGINVYRSTNVDILDVTINNPKRTGVVVNGSDVTVNNLETSGSTWHAINANPGSGVTTPTVLTVNGLSVHGEPAPTPHIYIDDISKDVIVNDTNSQYEVVYEGPNPQNVQVTARSLRLKEKQAVNVVATKIVCEDESDLPNWGNGQYGPITADTAADWVENSEGACEFQEGWQFQYADQSGPDTDGDFVGESDDYTTFEDATDENGVTTETILLGKNVSELHFREVLQDGYLPFSKDNENDVSAEFYCADDVLNYDNWDFVRNPEAGETYHCVAWNVLEVTDDEPTVCSIAGEVVDMTENAVKFNGSSVDANRRTVGGLQTVAPYSNFLGKDGNSWNPSDFLTLGVGGFVTYMFTDAVVIDKPGADIAIWEITGGATSEDSNAKANVSVSADGVTFVSLGGIVGDEALDIAPAGLPFVKYVKVTDNSASIGNDDGGDGYDVDAITIINKSCGEIPQRPVCEIGKNLLANGSFEVTPVVTDNGGQWQIFAAISDWIVGLSDGIEVWNTFNGVSDDVASDGLQNVELDGNNATRLTQSAATIPGATYELKFDFSPRATIGAADNVMAVLVDGATVDTVNGDGTGTTTNSWTPQSQTFVAASTSTEIGFQDMGTANDNGGYGPLLDNVALCLVREPEPLPTCSLTITSDATDYVVEKNAMAQVLSMPYHPSWVPAIGTSTAKWIWGDNPVADPVNASTQTFKKGFNWTGGAVTSATLKIASDNNNAITLGSFSGGNPTEFNYSSVASLDVSAGIVPGANTLSIEVDNFPMANGTVDTNPAGLIYELTITGTGESCGTIVPEVPKTTGTVTMCKVNDKEAPLAGWTMTLLGNKVEDVVVPTNTSVGVNTLASLSAGKSYVAKSTGTWLNQNGANQVDTEYSSTNNWATQMDGYDGYQDDILELQINSAFDPNSDWGAYNSAHTYAQSFVQSATGSANFRIFDGNGTTPEAGWYGDNSGSLNVALYEGFAGITGENGCVTFTNVPFGEYVADEIMQDGWDYVGGADEVSLTYNNPTATVTIMNEMEDDGDDNGDPETYILDGYKYQCVEDGEYYCNQTIAGWTIYATNGEDELSTTTDADGYYYFEVEEGNWTVSESMWGGWEQVYIDADYGEAVDETCEFEVGDYGDWAARISALVWEPEYSCDFGNYYNPGDGEPQTYRVVGQKWNDIDGNGKKDEGETGLSGWTIFADRNDDGLEPVSTTTDSNGNYYFDLVAGDWEIYEEDRANWEQTAVTQNGDDVITDGEILSCNFTFGEIYSLVDAAPTEILYIQNDCTFFNQQQVVTEEPETPSNRGGGGSSSGTRVTNRATPQGLVLGAATSSCGMYLQDYMRMGNAASTTQVTKLQVFLNAVGITAPLTGVFDAATDAAVRTFQAQHKAEVLTPWYLAKIVPHENPTGWVYQLTRWKINNIVCPGSEAYPVLN